MTPEASWMGVPPCWTSGEHPRSIDPFGEDPDDATLLAAVADGRDAQAAMTVLYDRYAEAVRAVCANQLRTDRDSVEDLVQDVLVLLQRYAGSIKDPKRLPHWLRRTAVNTCVNHRARAYNQREIAVVAIPDAPTHVGDFTDALGHADQVQRLLARLPSKSATLLQARYLRGMTCAEIAEWLGSTSGSIKSQLSEIRKEARRLVETGKAMIPLPVIEWWGRASEFLRAGGGAPATAAMALVPVLAVGLLVLPTLGGDVPNAHGAVPVPESRIDGGDPDHAAPVAVAPTAVPERVHEPTGATAPSSAASTPAGPATPAPTYRRPAPSPVQAVDVPVVGEVQTYEEPTTEPDSRVAVAPEQTGELVFFEAYEPTTGQAVDAMCARADGVDAVTCGP